MIRALFDTVKGRIPSSFACRSRPLRVTFDTNTLDRIARPERFPKDQRQGDFYKIHRALKNGRLAGFFSETVLTLEGIEKVQRADVFDSTEIKTQITDQVSADGKPTVSVIFTASQPARKPIHPETAARVKAAIQLGLRALRIPRNGLIEITDPSRKFFVQQSQSEQATRQKKTLEAAREIEKRDVGMSIIRQIGAKFATRANVLEPWYRSLVRAKDVHEENEVKRAISEWSDGDSLAGHIGYGIDLFCTEDRGRRGGKASILNDENRLWASQKYGVQFVTLTELAKRLRWHNQVWACIKEHVMRRKV